MQEIEEIAKIIRQNGGKLYLVGGAIRNRLLKKEAIDEDYCVTGLTKEKFQELFKDAKIQGKDFPVFILEGKEFALARKERKNGKGHKDFEFNTDINITIEEDLKRRDITINSIAQDVLTKEIIDPFNGIEDLNNRIIRKTGDAFKEDPLRVYRVARFASILDFKVDKETLKDMENLKQELKFLSKERVYEEFKKALKSDRPSIFFEILKDVNVLDVHFKEMYDLIGKTQPEEYHPEGDSYCHTMIAVDNSTKITDKLEYRFSVLVHDLGKGVTPKEMLPHHYGHDEKGIELVSKLGNRLGVPKNWVKCGKTACKWHMKAGIFSQMTARKKVIMIEQVGKSLLGLEGLKVVVACDRNKENEDILKTFNQIEFDEIGNRCLKEINGDLIKKEYPNLEGKKICDKLHERRTNWMKLIDMDNTIKYNRK